MAIAAIFGRMVGNSRQLFWVSCLGGVPTPAPQRRMGMPTSNGIFCPPPVVAGEAIPRAVPADQLVRTAPVARPHNGE